MSFRRNGRSPSVDPEHALERLAPVGRAPVRKCASGEQSAGEARPVARPERRKLLAEEGEAVPLLAAIDHEESREVSAEHVLLEGQIARTATRRLAVDLVADLLVVDHEVD